MRFKRLSVVKSNLPATPPLPPSLKEGKGQEEREWGASNKIVLEWNLLVSKKGQFLGAVSSLFIKLENLDPVIVRFSHLAPFPSNVYHFNGCPTLSSATTLGCVIVLIWTCSLIKMHCMVQFYIMKYEISVTSMATI